MENQKFLKKTIAELERCLVEKAKEVDYYRRTSKEVGKKLLRNIQMLTKTLENQNILRIRLEKVNRELKKALAEVKVLRGIVPICSYCKQIRDDKGYWNQIEKYISEHSEAFFSHSICPTCLHEHHSDMLMMKKNESHDLLLINGKSS